MLLPTRHIHKNEYMNRREYLAMLSSGGIAALSGCTTNPLRDESSTTYDFEKPNYLNINTDLDVSDFDYPDGFSEEVGDFSETFGLDSIYYDTSSFYCQLTFRSRGEFTDSYRTVDRYISDDQMNGLVIEQSPTEFTSNFYTESDRFIKTNTINREKSIRRVRGEFSKQDLYIFDFKKYIQGVNFERSGLVTKNIIRYTTSDIDQLNLIREGGLQVIDGQIDLLVRDDGLPYALYIETHTDFRSRQYEYRFSDFNDVYVGTPDWVKTIQSDS